MARDLFVRQQVEITLPITRLHILQAMPLLRQRPQRFAEHAQGGDLQRRFAGLGDETSAFHPDEIAEIKQREDFHQLRADFLGLDVNLDAPARVAHIHEMALAHVAMRSDPAGHAQRHAFGKFRPHFRDVAVGLECAAERRHAALFQSA